MHDRMGGSQLARLCYLHTVQLPALQSLQLTVLSSSRGHTAFHAASPSFILYGIRRPDQNDLVFVMVHIVEPRATRWQHELALSRSSHATHKSPDSSVWCRSENKPTDCT